MEPGVAFADRSGPPTGKEFIEMVAATFGVPPKYRVLSKPMLRVAGWFDPRVRSRTRCSIRARDPISSTRRNSTRSSGSPERLIPKVSGLSQSRIDLPYRRTRRLDVEENPVAHDRHVDVRLGEPAWSVACSGTFRRRAQGFHRYERCGEGVAGGFLRSAQAHPDEHRRVVGERDRRRRRVDFTR